MKLKNDFMVTELGDERILVPVGQAGMELRGVIRLNHTAAFIIDCLKENTEMEKIADALTGEYEVDRQTAEIHVKNLLDQLRELGALEE